MANSFDTREYGWTQSSDSEESIGLIDDELDSKYRSSDDEKVPFTRHGPVINPNPEDIEV